MKTIAIKHNVKGNIETSLKEDIAERMNALESLIEIKSKYMLELNDKYRDSSISREEYINEFDAVSLEMDILIKEKKELCTSKLDSASSKVRVKEMKEYIDKTKNITEFDGELLRNLVDRIKVYDKHKIVFDFKCGYEYEMNIWCYYKRVN